MNEKRAVSPNTVGITTYSQIMENLSSKTCGNRQGMENKVIGSDVAHLNLVRQMISFSIVTVCVLFFFGCGGLHKMGRAFDSSRKERACM